MKVLLVLLLALVLGLPSSPVEAQDQQPAAIDPDRQILVLLRQVPTHYRGGPSYGGRYGDAVTREARERQGRRIARDHQLEFLGNWPMPLLGLDCFIMAVPPGGSIEAALERVRRDADVEWSQPMNTYETLQDVAPYNDPLFAVAPAARQWHLRELHALATGDQVSVAVIDTLVEDTHPDLAGQVSVRRDFVGVPAAGPENHGTAIAGIIAAKVNNGLGSSGVAPRARLMALRACRQLPGVSGSRCDSLSLARALHFAIENRAQVINLSLGGPHDPLLARLLDLAIERGATIVAATNSEAREGGFPASHRGVLAVSNTPFTGLPQGVVTAPGQDVPTTLPGGRWHLVNGSSYAAAHVSGLVALVREGRDRPVSVASLVVIPGSGGRIDARSTLRQFAPRCGESCLRSRVWADAF